MAPKKICVGIQNYKFACSKICGWYVFSKLKFCGYLNLWVFKNCGYSNLWVHKICDDTKFQVNGREYQNICVLCISCEQKNICAFFHICFLPYVQNMPCELALRLQLTSVEQV